MKKEDLIDIQKQYEKNIEKEFNTTFEHYDELCKSENAKCNIEDYKIEKDHTIDEYLKQYGALLQKHKLLAYRKNEVWAMNKKRTYWEIPNDTNLFYFEIPNRSRHASHNIVAATPVLTAKIGLIGLGISTLVFASLFAWKCIIDSNVAFSESEGPAPEFHEYTELTYRYNSSSESHSCDIFYLDLNGTATGSIQIDWGDGSGKQTVTTSNGKATSPSFTQDSTIKVYDVSAVSLCEIGGSSTISTQNKQILSVIFGTTITSVPKNAFQNSNITYAALSSSVETIGELAFYYSSLTEVYLSNQIHEIGRAAFEYNHYLCSVRGLKNCKDITVGQDCFEECSALKRIEITGKISKLDNQAFYYCYSLREAKLGDIAEIGDNLFYNCYSLKTIEFGENCSFAVLRGGSFRNCYSLEKISIPEGVTKIESSVFEEARGLIEVHLPSTLQYIESSVFNYCYGLEKMNFPSSLLEINYCFMYCYSLKYFGDDGNTTFAFHEGLTKFPSLQDCTSIDTVIIPKSATASVDNYYFSSWKANQTIIFAGYKDLAEVNSKLSKSIGVGLARVLDGTNY